MALKNSVLNDFLASGKWSKKADDNIFGEKFTKLFLKKIIKSFNKDKSDANIEALGLLPLGLAVAGWGVSNPTGLPSDPNGRNWSGTSSTKSGKHLMSYAKGGVGIPHADSGFLKDIISYIKKNYPNLAKKGNSFFKLKGVNFDILYANGGHCKSPVTTIMKDLNGIPFGHNKDGNAGSSYCTKYEPRANTAEEDWRIFRHWIREALRKKDVQNFIIDRWLRKFWLPSYNKTISAGGNVQEALINTRIRNSSPVLANELIGLSIEEQLQAYGKDRRRGVMLRAVNIYEHYSDLEITPKTPGSSPSKADTKGANDNAPINDNPSQPESRSYADNNSVSNNNQGAQLPNVEGLTNFFKPTTSIPPPIKFDAGKSKSHAKGIKNTLGNLPFVSYNGIQFEPRYIKSFGMSVRELLPTVTITFEDQYGLMNDRGTPMDDSKITVFINSRSPALKSIFMRFKVTSFSNTGNTYILNGICDINRMFLRKFESYSNMSSFECLQEFAKRSGLGFNSNVSDSDDKMTWINPGKKGSDFVKDVISKSYRNDSAFVWCYIDPYYNLNYIDVEEALKIDIKSDIAVHTIGLNRVDDFRDDNKIIKLMLTNDKSASSSNNYFESWSLINNSTSISLEKGYLNKVKFYDINTLNFLIFDIDSITSEGDKTIIMKASPQDNEYFKEHVTTTYVGKLDTSNMHKNYNYSVVQNKQNIEDIQKIGIRLNMPSPNFNLYRFQKVRVVISNKGSTPTHGLKNNRLTGEWMIIDIKYTQLDGKFTQILTLVKRELELAPEELKNENPPKKNTDGGRSENTTNPDDSTQFVDANNDGVPDSIPEDQAIDWKWTIEWSNANEIEKFFKQYNTNGFVGWFAIEFGNKPLFNNSPTIAIGDSSPTQIGGVTTPTTESNVEINKARWSKIWNSIPLLYNDIRNGKTDNTSKTKVNGIEFIALNTLIYTLSGTEFKPISETKTLPEAFRSYNTATFNETAFKLFNDSEYNVAFTNLPFSDKLKDTTNQDWESDTFPLGFSGDGYVGGMYDLSTDMYPGDEFYLDGKKYNQYTKQFEDVGETYIASTASPSPYGEFKITGNRELDYNSLIDAIKNDTIFKIDIYLSNAGFINKIDWQDENDDSYKSIGISSTYAKGLRMSANVGTTYRSIYSSPLQSSGSGEKETDPKNNGYITNADFYKFRQRGFTPTIGREEYLNIIEFISNYSGDNNILKQYNEKWSKVTETINPNVEVTQDVKNTKKNTKTRATISTNYEWDKIMLDSDINPAVVAAISNYFANRSKEIIFNSDRAEDKVLKSIENIAKIIKIDLPSFDTERYIQRVKEQIEFLDKTELPKSKGIEGSPNPIAIKPVQADISKLKSGGVFDSYRGGKKIGSEDTVIYKGILVSKKIAPSLVTMFEGAKKDGIKLSLNSGFRTNEDQIVNGRRKSGQNYLYDIWTHTGKNEKLPGKKHYTYIGHKNNKPPVSTGGNLAAVPGTSNHQSGIAVDISGPKGSKEYEWLVANAWKYGFIRAVKRERWHWEFRPGSRMFSKVPLQHLTYVKSSGKPDENTWDNLPQKYGLA